MEDNPPYQSLITLLDPLLLLIYSGPEVAPTEKTAKRASYIVIYLCMLMLALAILLRFGENHLADGDGVSVIFLLVLIVGIIAGIFMLWRIPQSRCVGNINIICIKLCFWRVHPIQ